MGLVALTQLPSPGSLPAIVAMNLALAMAALAAVASVLRRLMPGERFWPERALLVTIVAVHPLLAATLLQLNPDFGVWVFFALSLAALVWRRYWLAGAAGLLLCFSKETGALIYCAAVALHLLFRLREAGGTAGERVRSVGRAAAPAGLPLVAFAAFLAWWGLSYPVLQLHQFHLQFEQLSFVFLVAKLLIAVLVWILLALTAESDVLRVILLLL